MPNGGQNDFTVFMSVDLWRPNLTLLCDLLIMNFMTKVLLLRSGLMLLFVTLLRRNIN